jgi:hypothetical protein
MSDIDDKIAKWEADIIVLQTNILALKAKKANQLVNFFLIATAEVCGDKRFIINLKRIKQCQPGLSGEEIIIKKIQNPENTWISFDEYGRYCACSSEVCQEKAQSYYENFTKII